MPLKSLIVSFKKKLPYSFQLFFRYRKKFNRYPNLYFPKKYSEKLYSRLINPLPIFSVLADKLEVRDYVASMIGQEYLIPLYGVYNRLSVEDLISLPNEFVIKANHGAGFIKIVSNKEKKSKKYLNELVTLANTWLETDYSKKYFEKHYLRIPPKIFAEKALLSENNSPLDYKFHVFNNNGEAPFIFIQLMERNGQELKHFFFLEDWTPAPFKFLKKKVKDIDSEVALSKPERLNELVEVAKKLASPFSYVRVDLYLFEDKIYFGELTFSPGAGSVKLSPPIWDLKLGNKFDWPEKFQNVLL